jgi:hypothetical protein
MIKDTVSRTIATLCAGAMLVCAAPAMAQAGGTSGGDSGGAAGGSAGDGDKPLNPANKNVTNTDPKDSNGKPVTVTKPKTKASSSISSSAK